MSRINEAWKRQATEAGALPDAPKGAVPTERLEFKLAEVSLLDRYAIEEKLEAEENPRHTPKSVAISSNSEQKEEFGLPVDQQKLVVSRSIPENCVEQFRRLAVALYELQAQQGLKILMVASVAPREGKTLTITNLALTLSGSFRQRTLLIDADLRHPSVHETLGLRNHAGLADVLCSGTTSLPLVELSAHMSVLTAGRSHPNPLSLLMSGRFRTVVKDAAARFDWVLIDTSPIGVLPDAQPVARVSEGVLFVISAGVTPYSDVQKGIAELGEERIVGTVLNRVDERFLPSTEYGGHYYS